MDLTDDDHPIITQLQIHEKKQRKKRHDLITLKLKCNQYVKQSFSNTQANIITCIVLESVPIHHSHHPIIPIFHNKKQISKLSFSPSSSVFSFVQLVLSFTFLKCGCFSLRPVSNTATFTPEPEHTEKPGLFFRGGTRNKENEFMSFHCLFLKS